MGHRTIQKVILSVCFYLNLSQNRIESPKLLSSFILVFLLQATFSHSSVNPQVQSNLGFPGKGGVGGCHGTILFLTCPSRQPVQPTFLQGAQAGFDGRALQNPPFCQLRPQVLWSFVAFKHLLGKTRVIKERPWEQIFQFFFFALDQRRRTSSVLSYFIRQKQLKVLACIQMPLPLKKLFFQGREHLYTGNESPP